uniref:NAL12 n=1 Tax=Electrophorus electricus TaxID=8005 RepID=A0AAY5F563_ELEEL
THVKTPASLIGLIYTSDDCIMLASALNSNPSFLRELDLSFNLLGDSGIKLLSGALRNPCCKLKKLKLFGCELTMKSCEAMSAALKNNSSLTELDLSKNALQDSGVKLLSYGLKNPRCTIRNLSFTLNKMYFHDYASGEHSNDFWNAVMQHKNGKFFTR